MNLTTSTFIAVAEQYSNCLLYPYWIETLTEIERFPQQLNQPPYSRIVFTGDPLVGKSTAAIFLMALKLYRAQIEFWHETNSLGVFWPVVGDQLDPDLVMFEKLISALAKDKGTSNGFLKKIQIYQKQEELVGKNIICARYGPYALPNEIRTAGVRMDSRYPHCAFAVYDFEDEGDYTNTLLQRRFLLPGDDMYLGYHSDTYIRQVKSDDIHGSRDHSRGLG